MDFNVSVMNQSTIKWSTSRCKPFFLILWITREIRTYKFDFFDGRIFRYFGDALDFVMSSSLTEAY